MDDTAIPQGVEIFNKNNSRKCEINNRKKLKNIYFYPEDNLLAIIFLATLV